MGADDVAASEVSGEKLVLATGDLVVPSPRRAASTRDRLIDAAVAVTSAEGWAAVTMAKLAEKVGVSRQTVYNEIGTKIDLAEAMILRELEEFLESVTAGFERHTSDLVGAIREVSYDALVRAEGNQLLHAIVSASHGADTELLPLLMSQSHGLLGIARELVRVRVDAFDHGLTPAELAIGIDAVVRVVLSQMMQPSGSPAEVADGIAWLADRVLRTQD